MKIYGINNNTHFAALRIPKQNAERTLSSLGKKTLEKLDCAGEIVKDTKFYHIYVDDGIYIRHINGKRLNSPYTVQNSGKCLMFGYKNGFEQTRIRLPFATVEEAKKAQKNISDSDTQIERTARIVKYLDDFEKKNFAEKVIEEIKPTDKHETKINKLINKYGV